MTNNDLCNQLGIMAEWCYQAQQACADGRLGVALDILQVQLTPKCQVVAAEIWRHVHTSGTMRT